jgi:protein-disulfide isomerase
MTIDLRIIAIAILGACKGAQDARAKTPAPSAESVTTAAAATPPATPATAATAAATPDPLVARADSGRIRGSSAAKVWLILASDFQCPYCKMWHDTTDAVIRREYIDNGKVRLAFVNFPLNIHPNAEAAAEYAMCAAAQDKFWPMHDALFAEQDKWAPQQNPAAALEQVATSAGVDLTALKACVSGHKMRALIEADHEKAARAGVRATPSFFIGNQVLEGVQPASELRKALDAALAAAGAQK